MTGTSTYPQHLHADSGPLCSAIKMKQRGLPFLRVALATDLLEAAWGHVAALVQDTLRSSDQHSSAAIAEDGHLLRYALWQLTELHLEGWTRLAWTRAKARAAPVLQSGPPTPPDFACCQLCTPSIDSYVLFNNSSSLT
jgi:hypothetical protein